MGKIKYLLRLDDACPTMHSANWKAVEKLLYKYNVRPMVGVIPRNEDKNQQISEEDSEFWNRVHVWEEKGWAIALHGYNHCCTSKDAGMNPIWRRSEFAGLPLAEQKKKIASGVAYLKEHGITPKYFFAPSHTFDHNTLQALRECSEIRIISDTIATEPYRYEDFIFIPQLGGHCIDMKMRGTWTFCLHPSEMQEKDFVSLEAFLERNADKFIGFSELDLSKVRKKSYRSRLLSWIYFTRRRLKKQY